MANKSVSEKVYDALNPIVENLGYELVEVTYNKTHTGMVLTLFIHKSEGITLDDCEKVSKAVDDLLDDLDPTQGASYSLNVSSLGLDRPIKTSKDAERNLGKLIDVKLFAPINGKKTFTGELANFDNDGIFVVVDNNTEYFEFKKIANAVLNIKF